MLHVDVRARAGSLSVDLRLQTDGPLVLAGPNGAGKSTALLLILGLLEPDEGRIALCEEVLFDSAAGISLPPEERRLGYVPQSYALFPHLTVLENVAFGLQASGMRRREARERAHAQLEELGLGALAGRVPDGLSGGEQQRVALARALAIRPRALLLDEPLSALDAITREQVRSTLGAHLARLSIPSLVVTHDPADAMAIAPQLAFLEQGRIVQQGPADRLRESPASPFVARFLSAPVD